MIKQILNSNLIISVALTGGGSLFISDLTKNGGASTVLYEAIIPYSKDALHEFLGESPDKAVSVEVSRELALRSLNRISRELTGRMGVGVTAKLALSDGKNEREGRDHTVIISIAHYRNLTTREYKLEFDSRIHQEEKVSELIQREILNATK